MTDGQNWGQAPQYPPQGYRQQYPQDQPWQPQQYDPYAHQQRIGGVSRPSRRRTSHGRSQGTGSSPIPVSRSTRLGRSRQHPRRSSPATGSRHGLPSSPGTDRVSRTVASHGLRGTRCLPGSSRSARSSSSSSPPRPRRTSRQRRPRTPARRAPPCHRQRHCHPPEPARLRARPLLPLARR